MQALLAELCPQFQDTVMYSRNSYKQINISCVDSPTFCYYFTQHFIKKKKSLFVKVSYFKSYGRIKIVNFTVS